MARKDDKKDKKIGLGENGRAAWEEEEVFRREGETPETLQKSLESQLEIERQRAVRVMADFENHKRRVAKERETLVLYANEKVLKEFLPVLDDLERAVVQAETGGGEQTLDAFVTGVRLILNRITGVLERSGVKAFDAVGEPFDPTYHEAVMQRMEDEAAPSSVLEELEKGYMLYTRLLRPTKAVVNAKRAPRPAPKPQPHPAPHPPPPPPPRPPAPPPPPDLQHRVRPPAQPVSVPPSQERQEPWRPAAVQYDDVRRQQHAERDASVDGCRPICR